MLSQNIIVGRIADKPILVEENGVKYICLTLSVPRSYKNESGEYEVDFINVMLNDGIASTTVEYCNKVDIVYSFRVCNISKKIVFSLGYI